jgi:lysyl-tRNA synthetase class 2/adenine-specific DNA-methyltransferase
MGPFIVDFYCDELNWVIELDGGQHNTGEARNYDSRRTELLQTRGVEVTRFWNNEVAHQTEAVIERLRDMAESLIARTREGTLTPALSQREREKAGRALSQRARERKSQE